MSDTRFAARKTAFSFQIVAAWLAALALGGAPERAHETFTDFVAAPGNGRYAFAGWTPKTQPELLKGPAGAAATNIVGHLFLPQGGAEGAVKVPAVLLMHGSGGISSTILDYWPKLLKAKAPATRCSRSTTSAHGACRARPRISLRFPSRPTSPTPSPRCGCWPPTRASTPEHRNPWFLGRQRASRFHSRGPS